MIINYDILRGELFVNDVVKLIKVFNIEVLKKLYRLINNMIENWRLNQDNKKGYLWHQKDDQKILYIINNLEKKHLIYSELISSSKLMLIYLNFFRVISFYTQCVLIYKTSHGPASIPCDTDPIRCKLMEIFNISISLDESDKYNDALEIGPRNRFNKNSLKFNKTIIIQLDPHDLVIHDVKVHHSSDRIKNIFSRRSIIVEYQKFK